MSLRAAFVYLFLGAVPLAHASEVTIYGAGLNACKDYSESKDQASPDIVAYTDWLSGYLSGVNTTSNHRNNFLSHDDLESAMSWLGDFCREHPTQRLAEAAWMLILTARSGPAAHTVEVTAYGSGYKPCAVYGQARAQQSIELNIDRMEFVAWLGGYLSGANVMSFKTTKGTREPNLDEALQWLDSFCEAHEQTSFAAAVHTLLAGFAPVEDGPSVASARDPVSH
jgi:hypothetical protein